MYICETNVMMAIIIQPYESYFSINRPIIHEETTGRSSYSGKGRRGDKSYIPNPTSLPGFR